MSRKFTLWLLVLMLGLAACNGNGDETETDTETQPETETDDAAAAGETITITTMDYAFEGVPDTVPAGSELTTDNQGSEPHEMVVFHIPDVEERSVQELLALPEDEEPDIDFVGAVIQLTDGSPPITPEGPAIVEQPGRYAMVCFFPVGLTDADLQAAMEQMEEDGEGPPPLPEGPPHFTEGMWAEFTVE